MFYHWWHQRSFIRPCCKTRTNHVLKWIYGQIIWCSRRTNLSGMNYGIVSNDLAKHENKSPESLFKSTSHPHFVCHHLLDILSSIARVCWLDLIKWLYTGTDCVRYLPIITWATYRVCLSDLPIQNFYLFWFACHTSRNRNVVPRKLYGEYENYWQDRYLRHEMHRRGRK